MSVEKCQTTMSDKNVRKNVKQIVRQKYQINMPEKNVSQQMSHKNVRQNCQTNCQTKMSEKYVRQKCQPKLSAILWNCTSMHFHDCFHFPFPRKAILGTQRYPNIKEMHENIKKMHVHTAVLPFSENPRIPGTRVKKCKKNNRKQRKKHYFCPRSLENVMFC